MTAARTAPAAHRQGCSARFAAALDADAAVLPAGALGRVSVGTSSSTTRIWPCPQPSQTDSRGASKMMHDLRALGRAAGDHRLMAATLRFVLPALGQLRVQVNPAGLAVHWIRNPSRDFVS